MASHAKLRVQGVGKTFPGVRALANVDLEVKAGEALAVMGANGAGKSTLMNILGGVVMRDSGDICIEGQPVHIRTPIESLQNGIAFVSQELNSLPTMSIAENIFADALPTRNGLVDYYAAEAVAHDLMARLGFHGHPKTLVSDLSTGDRQLVEIARALHRNPSILIFDEPTSSLSRPERERLFEVIASIKEGGVAVIYITHFLEEIFVVCDRVVVLRSGETVFTADIDTIKPEDVVMQMMGNASSDERLTPYNRKRGQVQLQVKSLERDSRLKNNSFQLYEGEIVGLWGLLGSGRTELVRSMLSLDHVDKIEMNWREDDGELHPISPKELHQIAGFVTEDRRGEGLLLPESAAANIALPNLMSLLGKFGLVSGSKQQNIAATMIERLGIKVSSSNQIVSTLSGGNQQKIVFSRWLVREPKIFFLDEPTRGLDVNAKAEILKLIVELSKNGSTILVISSELEELMRICDRYLIVSDGSVLGDLPAETNRIRLLQAVSGSSVETCEKELV